MKFILTIDTEADNQWDHGRDLTTENIHYIPRFQEFCEKYKVKPTYLVTSEICEDGFAKEIFTDYIMAERIEIGAHLHSWTTPPFQEKDGYRKNDKNHSFANELPEDLLIEKVKILTNHIESSFGVRPQSFRSGRYGFNKQVAKILVDNQYLVDSSVTPFIDWSEHIGLPKGKGGPDFLYHSAYPYRYIFNDNSLLELPVTILPTKFPLNMDDKLARYYFRNVDHNVLFKVLRRLYLKHQPLWLRPNIWMNLDLFTDIINEAERRHLPYIVMMFHSSELMPGCSIYWINKEDVEKLYGLLETLFSSLLTRNIESVTLTEAAKNHKQ
jgi:hypothetical protein